MKATDLRIGNYVNYEQTTHLITCVNIDYTVSIWVDKKENEYLYPSQINELKPIPLTEYIFKDIDGIEKAPYDNDIKDYYLLKSMFKIFAKGTNCKTKLKGKNT